MRPIVYALLLGFVLSLPARAGVDKDYLGFADKSDGGPISGSLCRSHGGQPLLDQHQSVVMRMGRRDPKRSNVIYHGGHQYVTFSIEVSSFWGRKETAIALCHFAG
jgi:hypothetical protein